MSVTFWYRAKTPEEFRDQLIEELRTKASDKRKVAQQMRDGRRDRARGNTIARITGMEAEAYAIEIIITQLESTEFV